MYEWPGWRLRSTRNASATLQEHIDDITAAAGPVATHLASRPAGVDAVVSCAVRVWADLREPTLGLSAEAIEALAMMRLPLDIDLYVYPVEEGDEDLSAPPG